MALVSRYDEAASLGIPLVNFQSSHNVLLVPSYDSVLFAVMEKGGVPVTSGQLVVDLTIPEGAYAWPMTSYSWLILRKDVYRYSCSIKTAAVIILDSPVVSIHRSLIPMNGIV
jgi:hypothetical protein